MRRQCQCRGPHKRVEVRLNVENSFLKLLTLDVMGEDRRDDTNYYDILGLKQDATAKEIASSYRTLALRYHPDKSTSSSSIERFHAVSKAYQVLADVDARKALDALLASRRARKEREVALDSVRRGLRDDLLQREREARKRKAEEQEAELKLQQEMERLRRDANLHAERKRNRTETKLEVFDDLDKTLKASSSSVSITTDRLMELLSSYGAVDNIVISKKGTNAVVRLNDVTTAKSIMIDSDRGLLKDIKFSWAKGHPPVVEESPMRSEMVNQKDFENLTLMRMRQRAERSQLRAKLEAEEAIGETGVSNKEP